MSPDFPTAKAVSKEFGRIPLPKSFTALPFGAFDLGGDSSPRVGTRGYIISALRDYSKAFEIRLKSLLALRATEGISKSAARVKTYFLGFTQNANF